MNRKLLIYGAAGLVIGALVAVAYKKASPPQPGTTATLAGVNPPFDNSKASATPNQATSTSEIQTPYELAAGYGGVIPIVSFPDINGASHNVTMNT